MGLADKWLAIALFWVAQTFATILYNGEIRSFTQPDGSEVELHLFGNQYLMYAETPEGFTVVKNPEDGWLYYAQLNVEQTELIPGNTRYMPNASLSKSYMQTIPNVQKHLKLPEAQARQQYNNSKAQFNPPEESKPKAAPLGKVSSAAFLSAAQTPFPYYRQQLGSAKGLTLLVDFDDETSSLSVSIIDDFLNKKGFDSWSNNGSIRDYFSAVSNGKLDYTNGVYGYYRAKKKKSYYDDDSNYGHVKEIIQEVLDYYDQFVDFSKYDNNGDGYVEALNILYAGRPNGWGKGLWPHRGWYHQSKEYDGVRFYNYQMTNIGKKIALFTFAHENGHLLFDWPDLYDYDGNSSGTGNFGLMSGRPNDYNPLPPNDYFRADQGWIKMVELLPNTHQKFSIYKNDTIVYKYTNPANPYEFFCISHRQKEGRWASNPGSGLLIYHIDLHGSNSLEHRASNAHYHSSIIQADNKWELETGKNSGNSSDFFHGDGNNSFSDFTAPDANWWDESLSDLEIYNISPIQDSMIFIYKHYNAEESPSPEFNDSTQLFGIFTENLVHTSYWYDSKEHTIRNVNGMISSVVDYDSEDGKISIKLRSPEKNGILEFETSSEILREILQESTLHYSSLLESGNFEIGVKANDSVLWSQPISSTKDEWISTTVALLKSSESIPSDKLTIYIKATQPGEMLVDGIFLSKKMSNKIITNTLDNKSYSSLNSFKADEEDIVTARVILADGRILETKQVKYSNMDAILTQLSRQYLQHPIFLHLENLNTGEAVIINPM